MSTGADDAGDASPRRLGARPRRVEVAEHDDIDRVERDWQRECPDIDVGSIGVVSRIWRVGRHLEQQRKAQLDAFGSDRGTIDVLAMLRRAGPPFRRSAS